MVFHMVSNLKNLDQLYLDYQDLLQRNSRNIKKNMTLTLLREILLKLKKKQLKNYQEKTKITCTTLNLKKHLKMDNQLVIKHQNLVKKKLLTKRLVKLNQLMKKNLLNQNKMCWTPLKDLWLTLEFMLIQEIK